MRTTLLILAFFTSLSLQAQDVAKLPPGRYETALGNSVSRWNQGDLVLLDDMHYKTSNGTDTGEYRFSATAQRVFFLSGPLKGAYAKTVQVNTTPCIIIPYSENQQMGIRVATTDLISRLQN